MPTDSKSSDSKAPSFPLPHRIIYPVGARILRFYLIFFRKLKINNSEIKGFHGPYVVVCNHQSLLDFGAVAACCLPEKISFVVSEHFFRDKLLNWLFTKAGCIPKRQFFSDTHSVRNMKRVIKSNGCIGIFPEGQTCWGGFCNDIDPSIGKLVKYLDAPVVMVKVHGNYLTSPKWSDRPATPALSTAEASVLITADQVSSLSAEEIADIIISGLAYDDYEWQRTVMAPNKNRSISGLDVYLWKCPCCGEEYTIKSSGNLITCFGCGMTAHMDEYGFIVSDNPNVPDTPPKWLHWQQNELKEALDKGNLLPFSTPVKFMDSSVEDYDDHGYRCTGEGIVIVDEDGMHYNGTRFGEPFTYHVNPKAQWNLTHGRELLTIDIAADTKENRDYAFIPANPYLLMKIIQLWPLIRRKWHENP